MSVLRQYVLSVVAAALICGILSGFVQGGFHKQWIRLICGFFLTITILGPLADVDLNSLQKWGLPELQEAETATAMGKQAAEKAISDIIIMESEAYILDKAAAMNTNITVEITLDAQQTPEQIVLCGNVSPYARRQLESILESDLGITKENQRWTG